MKEKIIEMLRNRTQASENLNDGLRGQAIYEYEFDYLADEIVKLFRQPDVISCVCPNEIKTGTVSINCCNLCGKPDEEWWSKH